MRRFFIGLAVYAVALYGLGALLLPSVASAHGWHLAKCQGPTWRWPYKHEILRKHDGSWVFFYGPGCHGHYVDEAWWVWIAY